MSKPLLNPLKVYKSNKDAVNFVYKNFSFIDKKIVVPYATHNYYTFPLTYNRPINYNFIESDYYNFWSFLNKDQEKFLQMEKLWYKPIAGQANDYYKILEAKYYTEKNPLYKSIIILILSRTNARLNVFGGPQDIDFYECFNDWYYKTMSGFNFQNVISSYQKSFDNTNYFIQWVPKQGTPEFEEVFKKSFNIDEFNQMRNCMLICDDVETCKGFKYYNKVDFENTTILTKSR